MEPYDTLIERAGLTQDLINMGSADEGFKDIVQAMLAIHKGKEVLYGNYMETHGSDPKYFALMEHYADVKRKFVRADNYLKKALAGADIDIMELLDTYCDIAVYGAIGVQLVLHLKERENARDNDKPSSSPPFDQRERDGKRGSPFIDTVRKSTADSGHS